MPSAASPLCLCHAACFGLAPQAAASKFRAWIEKGALIIRIGFLKKGSIKVSIRDLLFTAEKTVS